MSTLKKCDACALLSAPDPTTHVRTTNGSLDLCAQCLGDINRKSPLLKEALAEVERLKGEVGKLEASLQSYAAPWEDGDA